MTKIEKKSAIPSGKNHQGRVGYLPGEQKCP